MDACVASDVRPGQSFEVGGSLLLRSREDEGGSATLVQRRPVLAGPGPIEEFANGFSIARSVVVDSTGARSCLRIKLDPLCRY